MSKNTRTPGHPPKGFARGSRNERTFERFCTDWYMPETDVTGRSLESEATEPKPQARHPWPARPTVRPMGPCGSPLEAPGRAERSASVNGPLKSKVRGVSTNPYSRRLSQ